MGEYTFEVHNVKTLEYTLKKFIGNQICQSRAKPQPYYYPQCHCTEEKKHLSDSVDSRSVFVSHGFANNNIHSSPHKPPGPTRDCFHLSAEVNDPLSSTEGSFPLRHSFSTGDLLESSSSSSNPPRQVSHKTHVRLFVSLSGEGPCIVEDDQHQSNSTQCTSISGSVLLAHPKANSTIIGRVLPIPTSSSSSGTSTSSNNPKNIKQQIDCCRILPAHSNSQSPSEMLDLLSVTPKQATPDDVPQIAADFSNVGYLPRSSPLVSKNYYLKFKSKLK